MDEQFPLSAVLRVGNDGDVRCDPCDEYRSPIWETNEFIARLPTLLVWHYLVGPGRLQWERSHLEEMARAARIREKTPNYVTGVVWQPFIGDVVDRVKIHKYTILVILSLLKIVVRLLHS